MMKIMIQKIADGFDTQRGAVFGIETHTNDDTGSVMKISISKDEEIKALNKTTVHNIAEERSVGSLNNQLKMRGKRNMDGEGFKKNDS